MGIKLVVPAKVLVVPGWPWAGWWDHIRRSECISSGSRGRWEKGNDGEWEAKRCRGGLGVHSPPGAAARPRRCAPAPSPPAPRGAPLQGAPCSAGCPLSSAGSWECRRRDAFTGNHFQKGLCLWGGFFSRGGTNETQNLFALGELRELEGTHRDHWAVSVSAQVFIPGEEKLNFTDTAEKMKATFSFSFILNYWLVLCSTYPNPLCKEN